MFCKQNLEIILPSNVFLTQRKKMEIAFFKFNIQITDIFTINEFGTECMFAIQSAAFESTGALLEAEKASGSCRSRSADLHRRWRKE